MVCEADNPADVLELPVNPPSSTSSAVTPGSDADLLVTGRGVCRMGSYGTVSGHNAVQQVATQLGTNMAKAGQVLHAAVEYICPDARFG